VEAVKPPARAVKEATGIKTDGRVAQVVALDRDAAASLCVCGGIPWPGGTVISTHNRLPPVWRESAL
jgi:hypothetical protein